jgi:VIT1/CCC1 family predicted Fe2+/Mn2+ transporter
MNNLKESLKIGFSFGLVSGVLTTLGLLIGLGVSTESKSAVIGGILTIAIADALSDSFGVHLSQESSGNNSKRQIWEATFSTFFSKFIFALSFLIPVIILDLELAVLVSTLWGLFLIGLLSYFVSKGNRNRGEEGKFLHVISEHFALFLLVITSSYFIGIFINNIF